MNIIRNLVYILTIQSWYWYILVAVMVYITVINVINENWLALIFSAVGLFLGWFFNFVRRTM